MPGRSVSTADIEAALETGFPWHRPEVPHPELCDPEAWWARVTACIAEAICAVGCTQSQARLVSLRVRELILDPTGYEVFADVEPALRRLSDEGWIQAVVSNHIPELAYLLAGLGLARYFTRIHTSAIVGCEKPHAGFLGRVLESGCWPEPIWIVGDSVEADCLPARAQGCRALLVRTPNDYYHPRSADLGQAVDAILAQQQPGEGWV